MTTTSQPTDAQAQTFIEAVLAPLPKGEEPANSRSFVRKCKDDLEDAWNRALILWQAAEILDSDKDVAGIFCQRTDRMMNMPAPNKKALKWKREHRDLFGGKTGWALAIAIDQLSLRLEGGK